MLIQHEAETQQSRPLRRLFLFQHVPSFSILFLVALYGVLYVRQIYELGHTRLKRSDIKRRPLAGTVLSSLEPEAKEYRETYGVDRIYFVVSANLRKRWEFRYKRLSDDKWTWFGLGGYPEFSAKRAREKASKALDLIERGIDPDNYKQAAKQALEAATASTFRAVATAWLEKKEKDGRAESTLDKIRTYLDKDLFPALGDMQVSYITRRQCADLQASIEARGAFNVAKKTRGWLKEIFSRAIASGMMKYNPASELLVIAAEAPPTKQYPHLLEHELPEFMRAMKGTTSRLIARTAAWLRIWTASRLGMVRWAEWADFDLDEGTWSVAASKMKMDRDIVIPLSRQAIAAILELQELTGRSRYLFPGIGQKTEVISENTINKVFAGVGYKGRFVGHGTRHTASTLLREHEWTKDHIEMQLAHKEGGISGVYNKAKYLRQRRHMMQWYADYLDCLGEGMTEVKRKEFARAVNEA
ncbi:putative prophage CPS-53 integrase [compost metagenome]